MAPGVPFVPLAGVQLVAIAADLGLAVAALSPRWRRRPSWLVVVGGVLLAVVDGLTATSFGAGSSDRLGYARAAAQLLIAVGVLLHALGGPDPLRLATARLGRAETSGTAGAVVAPIASSGAAASAVAVTALLCAAAARRAAAFDRWWAALLGGGFVGFAVAAALQPAAQEGTGAAYGVLGARFVGALLLLAALTRLAQRSLLAQVVGASLVGVLVMAIGAVAVGGVVAAGVEDQQKSRLAEVARAEVSRLQTLGPSASLVAVFVSSCPRDPELCQRLIGAYRLGGDDFAAVVSRAGKVTTFGRGLSPAETLALPTLPLVQATLAGAPTTVNGSGTLVLLGSTPAVIGVQPSTGSGRPEYAAVYGARLDLAFARAAAQRTQFDVTVLTGEGVTGSTLPDDEADLVAREVTQRRADARQVVDPRPVVVGALGDRPTVAFQVITAPDDITPIGVLALSQSAEAALQAQRRALTEVFLTAVVVLLLVALVAYLIGRRVVRPVRMLTVVASQVRRGDFSARVNLTSADEVGRLGRAMDSMTASLQQSTEELRAAAEEQQALSERLGTVLDSMTEALVVLDGSGVVTQVNPAAARLLGRRAASVEGHPAAEVLDLRDGLGGPVSLRGSGEAVLRQADGRGLPVAFSTAALAGPGGAGAVVVLRDTTRDREVERMKTEFLSNVSHELRTPLTPIRGYAEILRRPKGVTDAQRSTYLDTIAESAVRMSRVVDLIVDVAALDAGRVEWAPTELDVGAWLDERLADWRRRFPARADDLKRRVSSRLPQVTADPVWLAKAYDELIDNALKHTPAGAGVTLFATAADERGRVRIGVKDSGPGLDVDALPELFADFRQQDGSATRTQGGLGLGLSFVRRIADAQGIELQVRSTPRKGAEFALDVRAARIRAGRKRGVGNPGRAR